MLNCCLIIHRKGETLEKQDMPENDNNIRMWVDPKRSSIYSIKWHTGEVWLNHYHYICHQNRYLCLRSENYNAILLMKISLLCPNSTLNPLMLEAHVFVWINASFQLTFFFSQQALLDKNNSRDSLTNDIVSPAVIVKNSFLWLLLVSGSWR